MSTAHLTVYSNSSVVANKVLPSPLIFSPPCSQIHILRSYLKEANITRMISDDESQSRRNITSVTCKVSDNQLHYE